MKKNTILCIGVFALLFVSLLVPGFVPLCTSLDANHANQVTGGALFYCYMKSGYTSCTYPKKGCNQTICYGITDGTCINLKYDVGFGTPVNYYNSWTRVYTEDGYEDTPTYTVDCFTRESCSPQCHATTSGNDYCDVLMSDKKPGERTGYTNGTVCL